MNVKQDIPSDSKIKIPVRACYTNGLLRFAPKVFEKLLYTTFILCLDKRPVQLFTRDEYACIPSVRR